MAGTQGRKRGGKKVRDRKQKARSEKSRGTRAPVERPANPVPAEPMELVAGPPAHGGAVIAKAPDGRTVFLRGAIEGETVVAQATADHKTYLWADTTEVLEPSPHRVSHVWAEPAEVGAANADLGHVAPEQQLAWKARVLADQIRRVGGQELADRVAELYPDGVPVQAVLPSDEGTRTRIQLVAGPDARLGMRPYRSADVVPVQQVPLAVPAIADLSALAAGEGDIWAGRWAPGDRVSVEAPALSPAVVVTEKGAYDLATGEPHSEASVWTATVNGEEQQFRVRPGGFWQTHVAAPSVLAEAVLNAADVQKGQTVIELYSGAGLFSRFLADAVGPAGQLLTLEGVEGAVADAGANLLDAIEDDFAVVYEGNVDGSAVRELVAEADGPVDVVVLDPPRKGAGKEVVEAIGASGTNRVVLVSCDPAAAARDIRDFGACGYELQSLKAWDLFPNTHHFETVAELRRAAQADVLSAK